MCVGNYTHIFLLGNKMSLNTGNDLTLSSANQRIHEQREEIKSLQGTVKVLEKMVAEESAAKYKAWKRLADVNQLGKLV